MVEGGGSERGPVAGGGLAVVSVLPALLLAGWLLAGLPLLLLGWFTPMVAVLVGLPVMAGVCWWGLRGAFEARSLATSGRLRRGGSRSAARGGRWSLAGVLGVAGASAVFNGVFHSEQLIVRRDPATYAQYTIWLAEHGSLPIPRRDAAFGGPDPGLIFASSGFYDFQGAVVPQFMPGPALVFTIGHWLGGIPGMLLAPPVLGAFAVLTVAGVAARLIGVRWAPLAALIFAVSLPVLYTSRTTFSEILSLILFFGGLSLLLDARSRSTAALAGLVLGLATPVRIDALRDILPVVAYAGLLIALSRTARTRSSNRTAEPHEHAFLHAGWGGSVERGAEVAGGASRFGVPSDRGVEPAEGDSRHAGAGAVSGGRRGTERGGDARDAEAGGPGDRPGYVPRLAAFGGPLLAGVAVGVGAGLPTGWFLAWPYLDYLSGSLVPLLAICGVVLVLTAAAVVLAPRLARLRWRPPRRLPDVMAGLVVLVALGLAARPLVLTVRREPGNVDEALTAEFVGAVQRANGMPHDPTRLYYEHSFTWVMWYAGPVVTLLAVLAAAVLARRLARGADRAWLLPLAIIGWTTITTLLLPAITPDHPFASRRLVPIVIPGVILLGVWGLRLLYEKTRRLGQGEIPGRDHAPQSDAASHLPPARHHLHRFRHVVLAIGVVLAVVPAAVVSAGTAFTPVGRGEVAAVSRLCAAIPKDASVLIVERVTGDRFTQVVRGMCGVPAARLPVIGVGDKKDVAPPSEVNRLVNRVRATGRRPILLAAEPAQLAPYASPHRALHLRTHQDDRSLTSPPNAPWSLSIDVWLAAP